MIKQIKVNKNRTVRLEITGDLSEKEKHMVENMFLVIAGNLEFKEEKFLDIFMLFFGECIEKLSIVYDKYLKNKKFLKRFK